MIKYSLICAKKHEFESWFQNSTAFDKQAKRGLVACPSCGSTKVEKALMAPRLARSGPREIAPATPPAPPPMPEAATPVAMMSPQERELRS